MATTLSSTEVCDRLGIRPQTLYAYVSRGLLTPTKDGRRSRFRVDEVEVLAQRTARGRRPGRFEVNIETAITLLDPRGRLLYRGVDATELAATWSYERVAAWLWTGEDRGEPGVSWSADRTAVALARRAQRDVDDGATLGDRLRLSVASIATVRPRIDDRTVLLATIVESLPMRGGVPQEQSLAARLWSRLTTLRPTAARLRSLEAALILFADHELAASTLAARVAASTWARPTSVVLAGLAALEGPLHGGLHHVARTMLRDTERHGGDEAVERARATYGGVPGLGHPVYRDHDPRCAALLEHVRAVAPAATMQVVDELAVAIRRSGPGPVNADVALGALTFANRMPMDAGDAIFAVARVAGWLAHADEESAYRLRFRPRAVYIGTRP